MNKITFLTLIFFASVACQRNHEHPHKEEAESIQNMIHVSDEEGTKWNVLGVEITGKILSEQTNGKYSVIITETPPEGGPPKHVHQNEDELFYVLKGNYVFNFGDSSINASQGDLIHLPKGIPHNFVNVDSVPGITMNTITPGGFENFFEDIAKASQKGRPSRQVVDSIAGVYGVKFVK